MITTDSDEMPTFHQTAIPILDVLKDGEVLSIKEMKAKVREKHFAYLSPEVLNRRISSGGNTLNGRIGWGKSYLKLGGYITQVSRGFYKINDKGLKTLAKGELTLRELKDQPEYIAHRAEVRSKPRSSKAEELSEDSSPQELIESGIEVIENQLKIELLERLKNVDPYYFEKIILLLLERMGYGAFVETPKSGDGGIDGIMNEDELGLAKIYIQAKRYSENKIREKEIRNFIGAMSGDTDKGIFVTTSTFDDGAKLKAAQARHTIVLVDGQEFVELMLKFDVGLQVKTKYVVRTLDEDFFDEE